MDECEKESLDNIRSPEIRLFLYERQAGPTKKGLFNKGICRGEEQKNREVLKQE